MKDRRAAWEDNLRKVKETYPNIDSLDWARAMRADQDVFTSVLGDILKAEGKRSRPGKRPTLDRGTAVAELEKLSGQSYTELPFDAAFKALTYGRSIRSIANKTGIQKDHVHRLLQGKVQPTFEVMEKVAEAFRKDPSYFIEYRVAFVLMSIDKYLTSNPDTATVWYLKMRK